MAAATSAVEELLLVFLSFHRITNDVDEFGQLHISAQALFEG